VESTRELANHAAQRGGAAVCVRFGVHGVRAWRFLRGGRGQPGGFAGAGFAQTQAEADVFGGVRYGIGEDMGCGGASLVEAA